ncbi:LysR family transcriptional regulator [Paraburkholderia xenovorans]|uniref:LysR family transcriptional regulator n=1 Tax=Paraburkholderia xenovorans TaxID=36873 RepID=UPI0038B71501
MQDLNALATFVAVVNANSFSLAAERCGISRALVSKHIQMLEASLGVKLLNRTTRRLGLTQPGERFYERCLGVLEAADGAVRDIEDVAHGPRGLIRVSTAISFGRLHLLPAIAAFLEANPLIQVEVTLSENFADLISGGADLVVRMADEPRLSNLVARKLAPVRQILVASPGYLASVGTLQSPDDLLRCNCLLYIDGAREAWRFQGQTGAMEIKVSGNLRASNADGIAEAALAGVGIGMLPTFAVGHHLKAGRLVSVLEHYRLPERTLYAVFVPDRHLPQRIRTFVDFISERFSTGPYWDY